VFVLLQFGEEKEELDPELKARLDELLTSVWLTGHDEPFHQIFHLIMSENVSGGLYSFLFTFSGSHFLLPSFLVS
jgi:hypothetical protein